MIKKRFIAGAICKSCGKMDTIKSWEEEGVHYAHCVACEDLQTLDTNKSTRTALKDLTKPAKDPNVPQAIIWNGE